jgi:hypothetical protein
MTDENFQYGFVAYLLSMYMGQYYVAVAPLVNFTSDQSQIDLGGGLRIRWMLKDEVKGAFPFLVRIEDVTHVLELTQGPFEGAPRFDREWFKSVEAVFSNVISCLRLFKRGHVTYEFIEPRIESEKIDISSAELHGGSGEGIGFGVMPYDISADLPRFVEFWRVFSQTKPSYMKRAIRRLNIGLEESDLEDRLLDYVSGLEAIFLRDHKELGYKLRMRAAVFLGRGRSKKTVAEKVGEAYEVRSSISHGSESKECSRKDLKRLNDIIETYLRQAIVGCLKLESMTGPFDPRSLDDVYLEAENSGTLASSLLKSLEIRVCLFCGAAIESHCAYCDACGRRQAPQ